MLSAATFSVGKAGDKSLLEEFFILLYVAHSTRGQLDMLSSLGFADKPFKHDQLFSLSYLVGLNSSPYRCNPFSQIYIALCNQISCWRILFELYFEFWLKIYHGFR
jgi:hypothetical protein